jgi:hypothetical protein
MMEPGDSYWKMMTFDDLARLSFETDPRLVDTVWNVNTEEMRKPFIRILYM